MNNEYLFVYGTLRKNFGLSLMQKLADAVSCIGHGEIEAVLYDLGEYPGVTKEPAPGKIAGEVFEIRNGKKVFPLLDGYEGEEYSREKVLVKTDNENEIDAWVYWYTGKVDETRRIHEGDYLLYLKNKKERLA